MCRPMKWSFARLLTLDERNFDRSLTPSSTTVNWSITVHSNDRWMGTQNIRRTNANLLERLALHQSCSGSYSTSTEQLYSVESTGFSVMTYTVYRWHSIGIAAKQAALVWACAAKRWWWLGEEMHGVWIWGSKAKRKTKEDLERGCPRGLSSS